MSQLALLGGSKVVDRPFPIWPIWDEQDRRAVLEVVDSGKWWMFAYGDTELGSEKDAAKKRSQVDQFEEEFAAAHSIKHGIAVTNGSTALDICMQALDLNPGDEVITTPYTFFATSGTILNADALPVYVDIDPETYNIDASKIESAITERTRAIIPVYFSGELADVEAISVIADLHGLRVIEDAAQSHGVSLQDGRCAGAFGDAAIFSFQQSKCLTAGEGGIILTDSDEMAEIVWSIRNYGRTKKGLWYEHHRLASNSRLSELQAALLRTQLHKLPEQNARRMANVKYFFDKLNAIDGLTPVKLHPQVKTRNHYLVMLRYDANKWDGLSRDRFIEALEAEGVPAIGGYSFPSFDNPVFDNIDLSSSKSAYMIGRSTPIDYHSFADKCPNAVKACKEEAVWLMHNLFLGDTTHVDMVLEAILKIKEHSGELA